MLIDPSKYTSFKAYVEDMPTGINTWIADRTGLSKMTISRLIDCSVVPTRKTVELVCSVTGLSPRAFGLAEYKKIYEAEG